MEDGFIWVRLRHLRIDIGSASPPPIRQARDISVTPAAGRAPGQPARRQRSGLDLLLRR